MRRWILTLDRILRGQATQLSVLRQEKFEIPIFGTAVVTCLLGILYGLCMGIFSITPGGSGHPMQIVAAMVKVPALFFGTLVVTFPSLYVFNALVGSRLFALPLLRLLVAYLAVMLAVLASIGPIVGFFSLTTTSYEFIILLNVFIYVAAGLLGLAFLLQTLHRMNLISIMEIQKAEMANPETPAQIEPGPLDKPSELVLAPHVKTVFRIWVIIFGLVGCQMAWLLAPFIGPPKQPFAWFLHQDANFFEAVFHAAVKLYS
jgi:hypothetical protein